MSLTMKLSGGIRSLTHSTRPIQTRSRCTSHRRFSRRSREGSCWGYEFTLTTQIADRPQPWAWEVLLHLARTTVEHGTVYRPGARLLTGSVPNAASHLTGFALQRDPVVEPHAFPFGRFEFLQLVGITDAERTQMSVSGTHELLARLMAIDPLGRTDPNRDSLA